jgi:hypothetical protein
MKNPIRQCGVVATWAIAVLVFPSTVHAQAVVDRLPPPPSVSVPDLQPLTVPSAPFPIQSLPIQEERVFQAPINPRASGSRYLVYVNGDSPYLLQQVRYLEPGATVQYYRGRRVIQVGTYNDEITARQRVTALNMQGIGAELTANDLNPPSLTRTNHYAVIIPASRDSLSTMAEQAVQMGIRQWAIQQKDAPLGPHLEIGPFATYNEAKEVHHYLRRGGLDARVDYIR